jgi:pyrroloquinoline quinone biosynthesis protein E
MVLNVVLHRLNIDHVGQILDMAAELEADYVELANTQYYGFAYANRESLLPVARAARARRRGHQRASAPAWASG